VGEEVVEDPPVVLGLVALGVGVVVEVVTGLVDEDEPEVEEVVPAVWEVDEVVVVVV
jgi:hypothetical protein